MEQEASLGQGAEENQSKELNESVVNDDNKQSKENNMDSAQETGVQLNIPEAKQENGEDKEISTDTPEITMAIKTVTPRKAKKRGIFRELFSQRKL